MQHSRLVRVIMFSMMLMSATSLIPLPSYAQENVGNCDTNPRVTAEAYNLDILLELTMADDSQADFRVSFLDTGTDNVHQHIDYHFSIEDEDGNQIFNGAPQGQSTLHTAEGVVTIPYTFEKQGDYVVNVIIYGVDFIPSIPQVARFPCNDIPEFPIAMMALAAIMGMGILVSRYLNLRG